MKEIKLTQGKVALVDDEDFERVSAFKWFFLPKKHGGYAIRNRLSKEGQKGTLYLHKEVLGVGPESEVDHRDGQKLNDQKYNLRRATRKEQMRGALSKKLDASSGFRGVCWCNTNLKWLSQIRVDGRTKFLGYFVEEAEAAKKYDVAAEFYFGDFAQLNFPK